MKYLGASFDIHGGGKDLIFPHHENEIAQSLCGTNGAFSRYWVHNGLVTVDGRKMSKSLDNFLTIDDAVNRYYPESIRYAILRNHYAANIDFSEQAFYDAYSRLIYFYSTLAKLDEIRATHAEAPAGVPEGMNPPDLKTEFINAMDDDFNTACALREIGTAFKWINDVMGAKKPKLKQKAWVLLKVGDEIRRCAAVLRLLTEEPAQALADIRDYLVRQRDIDVNAVASQIEERDRARADKDWQRADQIRNELADMGILIMDTPNGTVWQVQP